MRFALGALKWSPGDFWQATLPELECVARIFIGLEGAALPREGLAGLMARFPDA